MGEKAYPHWSHWSVPGSGERTLRMCRRVPGRSPSSLRTSVQHDRQPGRVRGCGQSLVEFALVAPVLFLLLFGVIEFGLLVFAVTSAQFAALQGARAASEFSWNQGADSQVIDAVRQTPLGTTTIVSVDEIDVFKVDQQPDGSLQPNPTLVDRYDGAGTPLAAPGWPPSARSMSVSHPDVVGVRVSYTYSWKFGLFADLFPPLSRTAAYWVRIEPSSY
jgi:hypothetical protein